MAIRDDKLAVWEQLLVAHTLLMGALERELVAERGLPLSWYEVLMYLNRADGAMRMQELARSVLISKSGLTRLVDRIEQAGLIQRTTCPSDRRGTLAVLTPAGKAALRKAAPIHLRGIEEHFAKHVEDGEVDVLRAVLDRVLSAPMADAGRDAVCDDD